MSLYLIDAPPLFQLLLELSSRFLFVLRPILLHDDRLREPTLICKDVLEFDLRFDQLIIDSLVFDLCQYSSMDSFWTMHD